MQFLITKIAESYNPAYGQDRNTESSGNSKTSRLRNRFFTPVLAPILQNRRLNGVLVAFGIIQLMLVYNGLEGWQCPLYVTTGLICPGCDMTTALTMLLRGDWQPAVRIHAFSPLILIAFMMMLAAMVLPDRYLRKLSHRIKRLELKTGITTILLVSMLVYWLLRISDLI